MGGLATSAPSPLSPKAPGELHGHERGGPLGPPRPPWARAAHPPSVATSSMLTLCSWAM